MAVNIDGNGLIALGGTSSTQGRLRLAEDTDNGTNYIELTAPASVGSDRVITFPDATTTVVGTDTTQTLTNKSIVATQLTGTIAAARLPAGSVLQVVQANYSTNVNITTTSTWVDSGLTGTITPTSASSKILVIANMLGDCYSSGGAVIEWAERIVRDATNVYVNAKGYLGAGGSGNSYWYMNHSHSMVFLDSPNTTSAITYKVQGQANIYYGTSPVWGLRYQTTNALVGSGTSTMTLMEIAA